MHVRYLDHSGFAVTLQNRLLIFDYVNFDGASWEDGVVPRDALSEYDAVYFFVSHSHGDHFSKKIYSLARENPNVRYFIAADVTQDRQVPYTVLTPGRVYRDGFLTVRAGGSTDAGVSFLIDAAGKRIFHAGDLNCWHWQGEWSRAEENAARAAYAEELDRIAPYVGALDLAFLPVDPRMKGNYDEGARIFAERFRPKAIVPMHFWGDYSVTETFRTAMLEQGLQAHALHRRGESVICND